MAYQISEPVGTRERTLQLEKLNRQYTRTFQVISDDSDDTPVRVTQAFQEAMGILIGSPYVLGTEMDPGSLCQSINTKQKSSASRQEWEVVCRYSSISANPEQNNPEQEDPDPLLRPPEFVWATSRFEKPAVEDINGEPVMNSAKQPFDPPPVMDATRFTLTVTVNEAEFDAKKKLSYLNTLNEDTFYTFAPGLVKCNTIASVLQYENDAFYWRTSYEFEIADEDWQLHIADIGLMHRPGGADGPLVQMTDDRGFLTTTPMPLNKAGHQLTGGDVLYMDFNVYKLKNFFELGLPGCGEPKNKWEPKRKVGP